MTDKQRGGARAGAGRKVHPQHLKRIGVPLRLPAWLVQWIDTLPGTRAAVIEAALLKAHKLKPTQEKIPNE